MKLVDLFENAAVAKLKADLLSQKSEIHSIKDDKDAVYQLIDGMMKKICKTYSMSGEKLHNLWVKKYQQIPDDWILKQK